jgi:hypothetical protein
VQKVFITLKRHGEHMNTERIEALLSQWMESELDEAEDYRATCGSVTDGMSLD